METLSVSAGVCLVAGAVIFFTGAGVPQLYKAWTASSRLEYLQTVAAHGRAWKFTNVSMMIGVILNTLGYALLWPIVIGFESRGKFTLAQVSLVGFVVAAGLWIVFQCYRLSVPVWAARQTAQSSEIPAMFEPLEMWAGLLFSSYMILAYLSIAAFGGVMLIMGFLPDWLSVFSIIFGLAGSAAFVAGGLGIKGIPLFEPPLMIHIVPLLMGIVLLTR